MPRVETTSQRDFAIDVLQSLRDGGFEAYWAGGCVRDSLLGLEPKDYDVATNATPPEVRRLFGRRRTLDVGAAFGVIIVLGPRPAGQVEVTTFRHDGKYSDGRHPDSVTFGTAEEDVKRRDFTINGMLYDPLADEVLDLVGGQADLKDGLVRAIGDARQRFDEDKLRMLRAVRFAARFGFRIEEQTQAAIREMADQVTVVAAERIAQEMRAILVHPSRATAMEFCHQTRLLEAILPELHALGDDAWRHTLAVLRQLREPSFPLALAALLHQADTADVGRRWRLSNEETGRATWLVRHHRDLCDAADMPWPRLQRMLITDGVKELLDLHEADALARGEEIDHVQSCREWLAKPAGELNPPHLITGRDLIEHGVPQGKVYKVLLDRVRDAQLERRVGDRDGALRFVDELLVQGGVKPSPHLWE